MLDLHFVKTGDKGKALIIMHGLFGSGDNWRSFALRMSQNWQTYCLDLRNHGRSPHADEHSYSLMADDLFNFFLNEHITEAVVLGHSMGGKTAMQFALNYPKRVSKLIVSDIAPKAYARNHDEVISALSAIDFSEINDRKQVEERLTRLIQEPSVIQFLLKSLHREDGAKFRWKFNLNALIQNYNFIASEITSAKPFNKPTLFLRGANSNYVLDEDIKAIKSLFPNAFLHTVANSGHWIHAEQPEAFLVAVEQFLNT